ncbi:hypothetical protein PoB_000480200 [Plakobranchus ocellatus]|uniref:Transmembrane protein 188 n=1 Tax=Plakobranchus ocellatus TaxID=259542 RepID=A0AAV3Y767_9GAST|nr:hypothetical protein PoB_000480200 [Plakobranchus ocellatus]
MSTEEEDKKVRSHGQKFRQRVEEFKLWSDDQTFKSQEYERRRMEKVRKKGVIKADRPLQRGRALYLPSILIVVAGFSLMIYSSIDALSGKSAPLLNNSLAVKIVASAITAIGVFALMATAAYTYHREDKVRQNNGFLTLYESSRVKGGGSLFGGRHEATMAALREFVDRHPSADGLTAADLNSRRPLRRMVSANERIEIEEPLLSSVSSHLRESSSSANSTMSWLNKHESQFYRLGPLLRRQSSDSALDRIFARSHLQASSELNEVELQSILGKINRMEHQSHNDKENNRGKNKLIENRLVECYKECPVLEQHGNNNGTLRGSGHSHSYCCQDQLKYTDKELDIGERYCVFYKNRNGWANSVFPGHPGVCASSTDSSGYTSSECYHAVNAENICTLTHIHNSNSTHPIATPHVSPNILKNIEEKHPRCRQKDSVVISTAAVHATYTSEENDCTSLLPPASPDISSLPYLSRACPANVNSSVPSLELQETAEIHSICLTPKGNNLVPPSSFKFRSKASPTFPKNETSTTLQVI